MHRKTIKKILLFFFSTYGQTPEQCYIYRREDSYSVQRLTKIKQMNKNNKQKNVYWFIEWQLKGIVHYLTLSILIEQTMYGHHNGVILPLGHEKTRRIKQLKKNLGPILLKYEAQLDWLQLPADWLHPLADWLQSPADWLHPPGG